MRVYGLDTETYDPHLHTKGASWVYGEGEIIVTGLYNAQTGVKKALNGNGGNVIKKLLLDPKATLAGTNIIYDIGWLCYEHKLKAKEVQCNLIDVSIAEAFINEHNLFSLDALALEHLKERKGSGNLRLIAENNGLKGDFRKHLKALWDLGYKGEIRDYVLSDADQPVRIWQKQRQLIPQESLEALEVNFKLIKIVLDIKQCGVRVDMAKRRKNFNFLKDIQIELQKKFEARYSKVNFNSTKQLADLFDRERIPYRCKIRVKAVGSRKIEGSFLWEHRALLKDKFSGIRIEKGQLLLYVPVQYAGRTNDDLQRMGYITTCNPNIDKKALKKLRKLYEVARMVADLKQATSILDKFLGEKFDRFIVKHGENNYRIHADFNICGARKTLRFSSKNPNLQQIPSKTVLFADTENEIKLYRLCREIIIPDEGMLFAKCDYSGQENRLMAHFAVGEGADEIRQRYIDNPDFDEHQWVSDTAKELLGIELPRKIAKGIKFGLGYGQQLRGLCEENGWTREEGEIFLNTYNETVPFVKATMDRVSTVITKRGYIKTLAGRRCHLDGGNKRYAYKGFNKLIQGSAADMTKKAMVTLDEKGLLDIFPLYLTVHDELDFGVPVRHINKLWKVKEVMENTYALSVPIRVDPEIGRDWGHLKKFTNGEFVQRLINRTTKRREVKAA